MATTVLSGTSGALYYKPAGTLGTFKPANVDIATEEITVETYLNFKVGDPVKFSVVNQQGGTPAGTLPAGLTAGTTYFVIGYAPTTGVDCFRHPRRFSCKHHRRWHCCWC